MDYVLVIALLI